MKYITLINIIVRGIFVAATFIVIKQPSDYVIVPLLWSIGYVLGGAFSIWVTFFKHKLSFQIPSRKILKNHLREGSIIFASDALLTIKDKFNYNLLGAIVGISDIVIYDIGSKISNILQKPVTIMSTALFPQMAQNPDVSRAKKAMLAIVLFSVVTVTLVNLFMPWIVRFFIHEIVDLSAIRLYSIAPIIVGLSSFIAVNVFFAFGKDKLVLKSSYVTTFGYIILLAVMYFGGLLTTVTSFVYLTIVSYSIEAIYRYILANRIFKEQNIIE